MVLLRKLLSLVVCTSLVVDQAHSQLLHSASENEDLYLWQGIAPFGSELRDEPLKQAFQEFSQYFSAMDAWRSNMYAKADAKPKWNEFREAIQDDDSEALFQSDYATLDFNGLWQDKSEMLFELSELPHSESLDQLGEVAGKIEFSEGSLSEDHLLTEFDISVHLGSILFSEFLHSIESFNALVAPEKIDAQPISKEVGYSYAFHPETKQYDQKLLSLFHRSIPRIMATLSSISDFEALGEKVLSPSGREATRITHRQRIDLERLEDHFEGTHDDFYDLLNSVSFRSEFYTDSGHYVASISYDAEQTLFDGDITLLKGGFALRDERGDLLEEVILPSQLKALDYSVKSSMHISMFGVDVKVDHLSLDASYKSREKRDGIDQPANIVMNLATPPNIHVSGAFFYFLPTWLIDLLIPGTIETLIADAFDDLIRGNGGKGFELKFIFSESNGEHILQIHSKAELPMDVIQELLKIEEEREGDEQRLYRTLRQDLRDDFGEKAGLVLKDRLRSL